MYEILFHDGHTDIVNREEAEQIAYDANDCERNDISQIHFIKKDGTLGRTVWTDEEGFIGRF